MYKNTHGRKRTTTIIRELAAQYYGFRSRRQRQARGCRRKPSLEQLEPRCLLAVDLGWLYNVPDPLSDAHRAEFFVYANVQGSDFDIHRDVEHEHEYEYEHEHEHEYEHEHEHEHDHDNFSHAGHGAGEHEWRTGSLGGKFFIDPPFETVEWIEGSANGNHIVWQEYDLAQTFQLHSNPSASHRVYLDFDGHVTSGFVEWNNDHNNGEDIITPAWSLDEDRTQFSDVEKATIQRIWARVAEDFAPFDLDVTTEEPDIEDLRKTHYLDDRWGVRIVIGPNTWYQPAGGVARLGSFDFDSDMPAFVFNVSEVAVAEAISHEVGHTLSLYHDGDSRSSNPSGSYYFGHGSGETGWAPIMGIGYYQNVTQWSQGEYQYATEFRDDLWWITTYNGFGFRTDDFGDTFETSTELMETGQSNIGPAFGLIETRTDRDMFSFWAEAGPASIQIDPLAFGANLDVGAELYDSAGGLVATSNPTELLAASFSLNLPVAGRYYLAVTGVGKGDPWTDGYSDYASLGHYRITGTVTTTAAPNTPPVAVDDAVVTEKGTSVTVDVLANDSDADSDVLTVINVVQPANGTAIIESDGRIRFTPNTGFVGTDEFVYTVDDGRGGTDLGTVTVTVIESDSEPIEHIRIIDNGASYFATTGGGWTHTTYLDLGHEGDVHFSAKGTGADSATWSFSELPSGQYRVAATWTPHSNRATNAPFSIDGGTPVLVNQQLSPSDINVDGSNWHILGDYQVTDGSLNVRLTDNANGYVIADAIRVELLTTLQEPEIVVKVNGNDVVDGVSQVHFGTVEPGNFVSKVFTVTNVGMQPLDLIGSIAVPDGFAVNGFGSTTLAPGASTTFEITSTATTLGNYGGQVSFANNDSDENPFEFGIALTISEATPWTAVIDNGDGGYSATSGWTYSTYLNQGYGGDVAFANAGSGSAVANWSFTVPSPGSYRVSATWSTHTNRASNAPYSVIGGSSPISVTVNQKTAPADFQAAGSWWEELAVVDATGTTVTVTLNNAANGYVLADAVRLDRIFGNEIDVVHAGTLLVDGASNVDFGTTVVNTAVTKTFTVKNVGVAPLTLYGPPTVPAGFNASAFGLSSLGAGESTTFTVTMTAASTGSFAGNVSFQNDDADENPFDFTITGTVTAPPPVVQIIDNGTGFSMTGQWTLYTGQGYENDVLFSAAGNGSDKATWSFVVPEPGSYLVSATWSTHPNRATNAPYTISGAASPITVHVNQEVAPNDFFDNGAGWKNLATIDVVGTALTVQLTDLANEYVIADAVRIERVTTSAIPLFEEMPPVRLGWVVDTMFLQDAHWLRTPSYHDEIVSTKSGFVPSNSAAANRDTSQLQFRAAVNDSKGKHAVEELEHSADDQSSDWESLLDLLARENEKVRLRSDARDSADLTCFSSCL